MWTCDNAITYLESQGYKMAKGFFIIKPSVDHIISDKELSAINYLCDEWDFAGIKE